ncbi:PIN domain-containing protein [Thiotrichales bacterium HSG14]|nr:PIN domain-containing protein [Thiotrichales bacterium HSG14]
MLVYFDTNIYSRLFDDQTQPNIQQKANACLEIIEAIKMKHLTLLGSDIVMFEVYNILEKEKQAKVENYLTLPSYHIDSSDEILKLGQQLEIQCQIKAREALHIASAIIGKARYFLSCDKKVTQMKQAKCYRRLAKSYRQTYFSVMNPIRFVEKMKKGELE